MTYQNPNSQRPVESVFISWDKITTVRDTSMEFGSFHLDRVEALIPYWAKFYCGHGRFNGSKVEVLSMKHFKRSTAQLIMQGMCN